MGTRIRFSAVGIVALALTSTVCDGPTRPERPAPECGGFEGIGCPVGQTCELPAGECQTSDLRGVCVPTPATCSQAFDPVCGCDGVTYSNDCVRLMARVQKSRDGAC